ncbi:MAG: hypothetical protein Q4B09_11860 [Lachnospiraceae bacterium]|nr:hypothetical protein [Lachnospiraceae bacterium]
MLDLRYEEICQKLSFRPEDYKPHIYGTEYDAAPNPFAELTIEELDYVLNSGYLESGAKKMLICMDLEKESEAEAFYFFHDGESHPVDGYFRIDKVDIDASEILILPKNMELTEADVKQGMAKVIRLAREKGKYPAYVTRAR